MTFVSKLTEDQILDLIDDYKDGYSVNDCSVTFKISIRTVYRILAAHNVKGPKRKRKSGVRPKKKPPKPLKPCGTNAAYQRHRKKKEYPCTPCLEAHALDVQEAKNKSKKKRKKK